jgi:hypothetical protein
MCLGIAVVKSPFSEETDEGEVAQLWQRLRKVEMERDI